MTISAAHALALQHHQAGRLPEAEALCRQILATDENHADAWHLLGVLAQMVGQNAAAVEMIGRAIALLPAGVDYHKNLGIALQGCGRTEEAIAAYRLAAERAPGDAVIWNNLGIALTEQGRLAEAIAACYAAIARQPGLVEAHSNLGNALKAAGQLDAALAAYRQALALAPDYAPAQHNLGTALQEAGQLDAAIDAFHLALRAKPDQPETYNGLGEALRARGRLPEALAAFGEAVRLKPELLRAQLNLSDALRTQGRYEACIAACQEALRWLPAASGLWINLGNALHDLRREPEAIAAYREALRVEPTSALAYNNLGNAHKDSGQVAAAVEALEKAIELAPHYAEAHNNLACARKDQGRMEAAIEAFREGHRRSPGLAQIQSNLIYTMHFTAGCDAAAIREEHRRWNECYVAPVRALFTPHRNGRDPARRLKVGYVSPDFWEQAECYFVVPLLEAHDHARYEIHAYSSVSCADAVTERLRKCVDVWHDVMPLTDAELAGRIRADGIDVLIDLTMHMAHSRLPLFALRPAPVQMSWLAYPGSTGVETMDCWITDAHMEPPGREADSPGGGEPVRLPDSWCCYDPVTATPEVNALPALAAGHVTFGSLNNFCKNNDAVLGLWARVLGAVPGSRLLLLCPHGEPRGRIVAFFAAHGVAAERVEFFAHHARYEYLRLYQRIDVGLDPFPYNGITTTCDALTMGVPVLTLPGTMPASRAGLSLLTTVGLPELALGSGEEYVAAAAALAADLPRLAELRATLRARMQASPLTDAPRFAGQMEAACRTRWERWCATPEAEAVPVEDAPPPLPPPPAATTRFVNVIHRRLLTCEDDLHAVLPPLFLIETHMTMEERLALLARAMELPAGFVACEIGSYLGASTCFLGVAASRQGGRVHCLDTWDNRAMGTEQARQTYREFRANTRAFRDWLVEHRGESLQHAEAVPAGLDLLFIDGDHSYEAVKADLAAFAPKLKPGGVLLLHDFTYAEVERAAAEYLAGRRFSDLGQVHSLRAFRV